MAQINEEPYSDLLGTYFTEHITQGENGQFFTPDPICDLMATFTFSTESEDERILDPACGSARTLLRAAKINPCNYFFGGDVSDTCAKMAVLNFFLNGLRGEVAHMNSLTLEFFKAWHINTEGLGILPIDREDSAIRSNPPQPKDDDPEQGTQLTFF